ncbi:transferrin isoform X1 [Hylaeus volcanicus]|uniref:transferrin isoform X1 n=2 Tax=Hylaeus volcanicus TaxID=313075 RepID=UPI0023B82F06|nr:transferrin isoform X1 [Hylaeus volcanicus]
MKIMRVEWTNIFGVHWTLKMYARLFTLLIFTVLFHQHANAEECKDCKEDLVLKLCIVETAHTAKSISNLCSQLATTWRVIRCVVKTDRLNCLRQLAMGLADFTVLEPEDLVAASAYNEYNVVVTNELRLYADEKQRFEMVVLVNKDVKSIWDVKARRFCHPGHDSSDGWTKAFSTYFEKWIIPRECDANKTLLENRVNGVSNFFEAACIAGPWSADTELDSKLKAKYRNLCAACDNPVGCYSSDKYHGREGALLCLTDNAGDIAWVRLDDTLAHFKDGQADKENYNYLCPDGTTRPMKFDKPCVWISKPWPVVIARLEVAEEVQKMMGELDLAKFSWMLRNLLENYHPTPVNTETLETPEDFLIKFPGFLGANNRASCRPSRRVQWCVSSNLEDRKCRWLREASLVYGVEPTISCKQEPTRASCLKAIKTREADIFVAMPEELLSARKMGLKPIVQAVVKKNNEFNRIAAVVKQDSRFKSLRDLKGAKACFTGYRDVGWNTFVSALRNISIGKSDCSDARVVGNFFEESCVLGLNDSHAEIPRNLYSLCKQTGRVGDDLSAFDCLSSGLGDVAFVNLKNIEKKTGNFNSQSRSDHGTNSYRTLCLRETDADEDHMCVLAWTPLSAVVAHENLTSLRREEIYAMLLEMDDLFGVTLKGRIPAFSMYGPYDSNYSVIFPDETQHLQVDAHQMQHVRSYNDIVNDIIKQPTCGSVRNFNLHYGNTIFVFVTVYVSSKLVYI